MQQSAQRQNVDALFVLGAGASYGLSKVETRKLKRSKSTTPLDRDFLSCLSEFCPEIGWRKNSTDAVFKHWFDRVPATKHGLEEAIIKRVSQYEFLSNVHSRRTRDKYTNEDYLNHLSHLIAAYLHRCKANSSGLVDKLANHIFPAGKRRVEHSNRIVTFNYDTLIEQPLLRRGLSQRTLYFDRLTDSENAGTSRNQRQTFRHPLILKLHGSTNWRVNRRDFDSLIKGTVDPATKLVVWFDANSVPEPSDDVSPMIIPPIPNKPITQSSLFKYLWTLAYEYLSEARKLVIVGYSCPPTDTLARTMFSQFKSTNLRDVFVVDPNANALGDYRSMFQPRTASRAKWHYYPSLVDYVEGEI